MKLKLLLVILLVFVQFSCNKWLELLPPEGLTRDQFWKTKEDVESVMMGAYASFATMDGLLFKYGEMRADMVKGSTSQGLDEQKIMQGNIYPDNSLCDWTKFYTVILYCNEVIKNAPGVKLKDNTFTDYQLQGYLSEAYFLRSLTYFYLVRIFKDVPLVLDPTESDMNNFYPVKTDGDTIISHIVNDLKGIRNYASTDYPTTKATKGRATRSAIDALLADISLWTFDYNSCLTYIANIEATNTYKLMPSDLWFTMYYPGNSLESIFELQYSDGLGQKNSTFGLTNQNAYNYIPSNQAVTLFTQTDNNRELVRGLGSIAKISTNNYVIWKFVGMSPDGQSVRPGSIQNSCGWIVYRYGDILLMKAEALSQLGRYDEALDAINLIRTRAGVPQLIDLANSASDYENAILNERSLELAFEGKRWYDLLRMGRRNNFSRKLDLIDIIVSNVPSTQKEILKIKLANPLGWYMPIFKTELEHNLNLVQNPYYNVSQ
jgi:starch-binding outer membrane protein, SusD/RagB family